MIDDNFSDTHIRAMWQRYLAKTPNHVKNLALCGTSAIKMPAQGSQVYLMASDGVEKKTKLFGTRLCHNPFACPVCSARVMAGYGANIACAIDALATWRDEKAFMVTFTLPHVGYMSCKDTYEILLATWRRFSKDGNRAYSTKQKYILKNDLGERSKKGGNLGVGKKGSVKTYYKGSAPYGKFRSDLKITFNCRVYEFTWSKKNGWHPHIHVLFWVPSYNWDKVLTYVDSLNDFWWSCAQKEANIYFKKKYPDRDMSCFIGFLYSEWRKNPKTGHRSVFFSVDKDGKLRKTESSHYISGWSGDYEMANSDKSASRGHLTPQQIIEHAVITNDKEYYDLYLEYAHATTRHRRMEFSRNKVDGKTLNVIIRQWKQTNKYVEWLKKKVMDKGEKWHVVFWFSEKQWSTIYQKDLVGNHKKSIVATLLRLARVRSPDNIIQQSIINYLKTFDIDCSNNLRCDYGWKLAGHVADKVFANKLAS